MTVYIKNNTAPQNGGALDAWRERINSGRQYPDAWTPRQRTAFNRLLEAKREHAAQWLHFQKTAVLRRHSAIARCVARADQLRRARQARALAS